MCVDSMLRTQEHVMKDQLFVFVFFELLKSWRTNLDSLCGNILEMKIK